jgi:hypothetical protein
MDISPPPSRIRKWTRSLTRVAVLILAAIGLCWLIGGPILLLLLTPIYDRQVTKRAYSPNRALVSEVEVTKGGLGTVWTTRVHLQPVGQEGWTIYKTKDSDFTPSMKWKGNDTLVIGLSCERFDYLSNPDDWPRGNSAARRIKVRFEYLRKCDDPVSGTAQHPL